MTGCRAGAAAAAALLIACAGVPATAQSPEAFFKDRTIKIMVGHPPGGGFDAYARLAGDMLKKHIPGLSAVIVENKPGGGGSGRSVILLRHRRARRHADGCIP